MAAPVTDMFPAAITSVSWTAVASAGSSVGAASGVGNINTFVTLLPGGTATYTALAQISPSATGLLTNTATVAPPAGLDTNPGNNSATDTDTLLATPTLTTAASPNVTLSEPAVTLGDSATLSGGSNPTGSIVFMLNGPGGFSFTATDSVSGNGIYTAAITLPTAGPVAGTYSWIAQYTGDANNNPATAPANPAEQTAVSPASPGLSTTASSGGLPGSTLTDIAHLSGGYFPTGTITFMLTDPGGSTVDTETVMVMNGNADYTTPTGFTATAVGTYSWHVLYNGDGNNNAATGNLENVTVAVSMADLQVAVTDGVTTVVPGTVDTYTITVTNNGPGTVNGVNLIDAIPGALLNPTFGPASQGSYNSATGEWSGLSLASGQSVFITLSGVIAPNATGTISNTVTVAPPAGVTDSNPGNNVATDTDTLTPLSAPNPSPPPGPPPPATSANMILRQTGSGQHEIYNLGNNTVLAAFPFGQVGTDWAFVTLGGFSGSDTSDMMLRNSTTGAFQVYDVSNNNITGTAALGAVGLNWQVGGFGNFSSLGETDMILRDANAGGFQVYDIRNNQITGTAFMGTVGWSGRSAASAVFRAAAPVT